MCNLTMEKNAIFFSLQIEDNAKKSNSTVEHERVTILSAIVVNIFYKLIKQLVFSR